MPTSPRAASAPRTLPSPTRRMALIGTAAVGAAAVLPVATARSAHAATPTAMARTLTRKAQQATRGTYVVPKKHTAALPDARTRLLLSRFTSGVTPQRIAEVEAAGGPDAWFALQLTPDKISDVAATRLWSWFPLLALTPAQKWAKVESGQETGWQFLADHASWIMMRRFISKRAVEEMMVDFWSNLLHVQPRQFPVWVQRVEYQQMIRSHALGRFDDLLQGAIAHPAMGLYLNNAESTARAINENLGREVLECHTVGVQAGYSEDEVLDSARILTGFHVDREKTWVGSYVPADHWRGQVKVLGFSSANAQPDGRPVLAQYLKYLAHHPATAKRLCRRLAVRFMSDDPSEALVNRLATVYLNSQTAIIPVLRALVASSEFLASAGLKVRTPVEDTLASWTAVGAVFSQPHQDTDAANQMIYISNQLGQFVYDWPTPDAFPDVAPAWTTSGRIVGSMRAHWRAASGYYPTQGITYRKPMDWMPPLPASFADVVDHLVRSVLFLPCTSTMMQAACVATDLKVTDTITATHPLTTYKFSWLLVSILDTPEHLCR